VGLVEDDARVGAHVGVDQRLSQEEAVRHVLDLGLGTGAVLEADRVANLFAEPATNLFGDALGDRRRRDTTRLRAANLAAVGKALLGQELRHLRRLARSRLADDDQDIVLRAKEIGMRIVSLKTADRRRAGRGPTSRTAATSSLRNL
jgi:hypothetical protein